MISDDGIAAASRHRVTVVSRVAAARTQHSITFTTHTETMKLLGLLLGLLHSHSSVALQLAPKPFDRRAALCAAASVLPLFAGKAHAITDYAKKDFKDGVYVGPSVVGAAPTAEGEAQLEALYLEALAKQEKVVAGMGFEMDASDRLEVEMLVRTAQCGFQAKIKCKGTPAAKNGGR